MLSSWRRGAIVALTAGAAVAAQLVAIAPAQAAGPTVTITATSRFLEITNDVFVVYRAGAYSNATIHGTVSGAAAGEVATLFAQQFPFKEPPVKAGSITLTAAKKNYSFTVTPNLYTKTASACPAPTAAACPASRGRLATWVSGPSVRRPR